VSLIGCAYLGPLAGRHGRHPRGRDEGVPRDHQQREGVDIGHKPVRQRGAGPSARQVLGVQLAVRCEQIRLQLADGTHRLLRAPRADPRLHPLPCSHFRARFRWVDYPVGRPSLVREAVQRLLVEASSLPNACVRCTKAGGWGLSVSASPTASSGGSFRRAPHPDKHTNLRVRHAGVDVVRAARRHARLGGHRQRPALRNPGCCATGAPVLHGRAAGAGGEALGEGACPHTTIAARHAHWRPHVHRCLQLQNSTSLDMRSPAAGPVRGWRRTLPRATFFTLMLMCAVCPGASSSCSHAAASLWSGRCRQGATHRRHRCNPGHAIPHGTIHSGSMDPGLSRSTLSRCHAPGAPPRSPGGWRRPTPARANGSVLTLTRVRTPVHKQRRTARR
jgi:hypothetical protein